MSAILCTTAVLIAVSVIGCASVPKDSNEKDKEAKQFAPPPKGKASLYLIRNTTFGQFFTQELTINGLTVANTAPMTYVKFDLLPGHYFVGSRGETFNQIEIQLQEGEIKYLRQKVWIGSAAWT